MKQIKSIASHLGLLAMFVPLTVMVIRIMTMVVGSTMTLVFSIGLALFAFGCIRYTNGETDQPEA